MIVPFREATVLDRQPNVVNLPRFHRQEAKMGYFFIAPAMLLYIIFAFVPSVMALILSFTDYDILNPPHWQGISNYIRLIHDPVFITSLRNILYYAVMYVPAMTVLSLLTAVALNRKMPGMKFYQTIYYIPVITSPIAAATVWAWLFNPDYGPINTILSWFGIRGPAWLYDTNTAMICIMVVTVWQGLGGNMMIYLAGLKGIPSELYEAAELDGANAWQRFRYVTWPSLRTTTFFVTTTSLIGAFQLFDQSYAMTQGGPGNATTTPIYQIYNNGFGELQMGYASAQAFSLFLIILVVSMLNMRMNREQNLV
ncbi:MAG: sugar ABC transporter permease [Alicyclobacillus sp.]|nr:sugar ABC transporter permease [Alicyclobacillus sp.]